MSGIQGVGPACFDMAKATRPGADIAHQQKGRRTPVPALADVGAHSFLTHGVQAVVAH